MTVIAIGASTGGAEAIQRVLMAVPADCPGILIVQHIPAVFSKALAGRLNQLCAMEVKEAANGDLLTAGRALVAPGNFHMLLRRSGITFRVAVQAGPPVNYQRPAVNLLFSSVVEACGRKAIGVLLTGMGSDGAQGLLKLKRAGAFTIVQDEATSVVFGMPGEAIRLGAACQVLPLGQIVRAVLAAINGRPKPTGA